VTNLLRLLSLNAEVQVLLEESKLEMGHARALLALKGHAQSDLAKKVVEKELSVRETERLINRLQNDESFDSVEAQRETSDPNIRRLENSLSEKFGAVVKISHGSKGQGKVVISYNDVDELEGILAHFK
jgi:ParB family chromosome partitioning protein